MLKSYKQSDLFGYFWRYPALSALLHSFTEWDLVNVEFIGIDNFKRLFSDKIFWKSCGNLLILMSTGLVLGNLAPLVLAELLHNLKSENGATLIALF